MSLSQCSAPTVLVAALFSLAGTFTTGAAGAASVPSDPSTSPAASTQEVQGTPDAAASRRDRLTPLPPLGAEVDRLPDQERQQLQTQWKVVEQLQGKDGVPDSELANAYGRMGQLDFAFDLVDAARIAFGNAIALDPDQFGWHYYLAALHMGEGEMEEALGELDRVLELRTNNPPSLIRRGRVLLDLGRLDEAKESFSAALKLAPGFAAAAHEGLGNVSYKQGDLDGAIEHFKKALELQPEATALHYRLGLAYRKQGNMERAKEELALNESDEVLFPDPPIAVLDRFVRNSASRVTAANRAMQRGDVEQAAALYREAVKTNPDDALAHYNLGFALVRLGHPEEAETEFRKTLEIDPKNRDAHFNLATSLARKDQWAEAAEHFRRSYELDPRDHPAHLEWARALLAMGQDDAAEKELAAVIDECESYEKDVMAEAHVLLGGLAARGDDPETAAREYRQAAELDPGSISAQKALASLLGAQGRFDEAAEHLDRVVALEPKDVEARFHRALSLIYAGRDADARHTLEGDLQAVGGALPLIDLMARLLATSPDPAVRDGDVALKLAIHAFRQQGSLERIETIAMAWAEVGNFDNATEWEQRVVNIAERRGRTEVAARARERLAGLQRGEPIRSPWNDDRPGTGSSP